jgi:Fic family protein
MGGRRARAAVTYSAFVPDLIATVDPAVDFATAAAIDAAEVAIVRLNGDDRVSGLEAVGPLLLRSEAIASSRIEGFDLSPRNLARALLEPRAARGTARAVAANVRAMEHSIAIGDRPEPLATDDVLSIHRTLMAHESTRVRPGEFRTEQNWIGGRLQNPSDARFVPPPEEEVEPLMADLMAFVARDDLPAVAQAAIAHAQFETIHPFLDGNGRVGRCLIHIVLRRRGIARTFVPPISVALAARPNQYVDGLTSFREGRVASWCASFAGACERAAVVSSDLADDVARLVVAWRERAGRPRRDSAAARIIPLLPAHPIASAATIRDAIGSRHQRALEGLKVLADKGVIRQISTGDYDRQFAADELFDLIDAFEERLAGGGR